MSAAADQAEPGRIVFIGFGEAAMAFVSGWALADPSTISAFDIKSADVAAAGEIKSRFSETGVSGCRSASAAVANADVVFSTVTADQALVAASSAAGHLKASALWLDCNSCAPETKRAAAAEIEAAGGRYVDVAVMAPVHPKRHKVPLLASGPHAEAAADALRTLDMEPTIVGDEVGQASTIKMLRSVMIKGMEALTAECFLAARRAGVEQQVLASLAGSDPAMNWEARGAYNLERMMVHGQRRAAEMKEVARTVKDLGLPAVMATATSEWQERIGQAHAPTGEADLFARASSILSRL